MASIYQVPAGHTITVTADGWPAHVRMLDDPAIGGIVYATQVWGPYKFARTFSVGGGDVVVAEADAPVMLLSGAGAPVSAVRATVDINPTGDDNGLTFTARQYGAGGNRISVQYLDPAANDAALSVSVSGLAIVVSLATGEAGAITSTAAEILAAIEASQAATEIVAVAIDAADSGEGDDGSGIVTEMARTHLADGAGTAIGEASPGALYVNTDAATVYRNSGTRLAPVWTIEVQSGYAAAASTVNALAALHLYGAGVPVDYTDGDPAATGEGTSPKGALYSDTTNGLVYRNSGTQAQPIWTRLGDHA
jgi:hypothetical protein